MSNLDEDLNKFQRPEGHLAEHQVKDEKRQVVIKLSVKEEEQRRQAERRAWNTFFCLSVWCG